MNKFFSNIVYKIFRICFHDNMYIHFNTKCRYKYKNGYNTAGKYTYDVYEYLSCSCCNKELSKHKHYSNLSRIKAERKVVELYKELKRLNDD